MTQSRYRGVGHGSMHGVRIAGSGVALPERRLTNADLEAMMDTSDEWITQRTGIRERRMIDRENRGECTLTLSVNAVQTALKSASIRAKDVELVVLATMTPEMPCPQTSSRVVDLIGATPAGGWDLTAACCGFVFGLNSAAAMIHAGMYKTIALIGADTLTKHMEYNDHGRASAILFGDGAGAIVLTADTDTSKGVIAQSMHSDGGQWEHLYIPEHVTDSPDASTPVDPSQFDKLVMNGRAVFKFAVTTFSNLIAETLDKAGMNPEDVDHYVCHQSNARILESSRERFGLPQEKLHVNIDRFGNTVAASVPIVYQELVDAGKIHEGQRVMFLGFGGGLTWGSSLWQM
ncbi:MAG: ketoacyl-ACP synthase III [Phycisphaeraceae bacterium]|nr:ketoacyl-ACP synthase III [Phycisphaerales bacterium]MCB9861524.1 ketoacyl-ACP synthase III [Phycisphaeraceae bacterium]